MSPAEYFTEQCCIDGFNNDIQKGKFAVVFSQVSFARTSPEWF